MVDLDQASLNLRYAQAQERRMYKLEQENKNLREIVEVLRQHLINTKGHNKISTTAVME